MNTKEETLLRDVLIGARSLTSPEIELDTSLRVSQRLDEYNASVSKIRSDATYDAKIKGAVPWGNHVLQLVGNFQIRTCPMLNYYRFYACRFAQEDSFHNYVMINDEEFDLPPTTFQGLSKADIAILGAAECVLRNIEPPKNGLTERHRISVIQFFVKNVVAGTDDVVTCDNELFSTWGVGTTRVRAFSYDPDLIKAAYMLLEAIREADDSLASKLKIAGCYIRYLGAQLLVLNVSDLSMNTELHAEIIYYTQIFARATRAVDNVNEQLPDWFLCEEDRTAVHFLPDLSGPIHRRYHSVLSKAFKSRELSPHHISNEERLEFGQHENLEAVPTSELQAERSEICKKTSGVGANLTPADEAKPNINWLWVRNRRGNDVEKEWNVHANDSMPQFEVARMPEGGDFTVDAIRELLYNKENHEEVACRGYVKTPDGDIVGVKEFRFGACDVQRSSTSFSLLGGSLQHVLIYVVIGLSKNAEITLEWADAVANCVSIIASPVKVSASAVGTSLNAGQLLQCYHHFVRPVLLEALEDIRCDKHNVQVDLHGFADYVEDKFRAIADAYGAQIARRAPVRHQAVDCARIEKYVGPDVDFKFYTVKELSYVKDYLTSAPDRKLSMSLGSKMVTFSIDRRGQIKINHILSTVKRLLPKEVTMGPSFAQAKWILPGKTDWDTSIADVILSCAYSRKAALWLYNNIIVGRVPINSQSPCTAGIPKIALKENGYALMRGLAASLLDELPHIFSPQSRTTYMTPLPSGNVFELSYSPRRGMMQLSELPELKEDVLDMKRVSVQYWVKAG